MGMDELYLLGKPRGMITNVGTRGFVEMLPDRKKQTILRFLTNLPDKATIQVCVIDMWRPYLEALNEALPHVTVIIDKFHVVKLLSDIVETVRKEIRGTLNDRQRRELMHDRFLLLKRPDTLSDQERLILESWLGSFPRLKAVYERKEEFYAVYDAQTKEEAIKRYFVWFDHVVQSGVFDAFLSFTLTIENWGEFVFNYFTFRYTGGFVEAANGIGRVIDRQGRGYSFDVLRARLLYGQSLRQRRKRKESTVVDEHEGEAMSSTRETQGELLLSGAQNTTESD
jgi:transposase